MQIRLAVPPDPDRLVRAGKLALSSSMSQAVFSRPKVTSYIILSVIFLVLLGLLAAAGHPGTAMVIFLIVGVPVVLAVPVGKRMAVPGMRRAAQDPSLNQPMEIDLSDQGIRVRLPDRSSDYDWSVVRQVQQDYDFWFLEVGIHQWLALPKKVFEPGDTEEFRSFLAARGLVTK